MRNTTKCRRRWCRHRPPLLDRRVKLHRASGKAQPYFSQIKVQYTKLWNKLRSLRIVKRRSGSHIRSKGNQATQIWPANSFHSIRKFPYSTFNQRRRQGQSSIHRFKSGSTLGRPISILCRYQSRQVSWEILWKKCRSPTQRLTSHSRSSSRIQNRN